MCATSIYVITALFGLFLIDNFFSSLFSAIICGFLVYFYVVIFWESANKNCYIVPLICKIWNGISFLFRFWRYIATVFISIFHPKEVFNLKNFYRDHCTGTPSLEQEIDTIVLKVSQCYLHSWYDEVSEEDEVILYMNTVIKNALTRLCFSVVRENQKRRLCTFLQLYLHFFIHFISSRKKGEINYKNFEMKHWACQDPMTERCYLQSLISLLINKFGSANYQDSVHSKISPIIHNFIVEIISEHILCPLTNMLSNPSQLNIWTLKILKAYVSSDGDYDSLFTNFPTPDIVVPINSCSRPKLLFETQDNLYNIETHDNRSVSEYNYPHSIEFSAIDDSESKDDETFIPPESCESINSNTLCCIKSSSSINVYNSDFLHVKEEITDINPSLSTDKLEIKRSKSADFIQQMPLLKVLNIKESFSLKNKKDITPFKSDVSVGNVEQAEEAVEVPKLFSNIRISDTFQHTEAGILPYTLYSIKYVGVFCDMEQLSEKLQFIKQEVTIRRRFREFLALQSRLENNPSLKTCLKGIKGPNKWLALPFYHMEKSTIAERKSFLENYLKELCNQETIAQSEELQEFLAYRGETTISFLKKSIDINVPRIDKILVRSVKGAIDILKTALPNTPAEVGFSTETSSKFSAEDLTIELRFPEFLLEYSTREPGLRRHLKSSIKNISSINNLESFEVEDCQKISMIQNISSIKSENSCPCLETFSFADESFSEENPLGNCVVDILIECLKMKNFKNIQLFSLMKLLIFPIERCVVALTEEFSEQNFAILLHKLHKALWPTEVSIEAVNSSNHSSNINTLKRCTKAVVKLCLQVIHFIISSIQNEQLNRCLLFYLYDAIVDYLC